MKFLIFLPLCAALAAPVRGDTLTLEAAVQRALRSNPDLTVARHEIAIAEARTLQAGLRPNPEFETEVRVDRPITNEGQYSVSLGWSQAFPVTARLRLEKEVSWFETEIARAEILNRERLLAGEVAEAWIEARAAELDLEVRRRQAELLKEVATATDHRIKDGQGSRADGLSVAVETKQLAARIRTKETNAATLRARLAALTGSPLNQSIALSGDLPSSAPPAPSRERPDITLARAGIAAARTSVELALAGKWEDMKLGVMIENERSVDQPGNMPVEWFTGVKFSIPLPMNKKAEAVAAEKQALLNKAEALLAAVRTIAARETIEAGRETEARRTIISQELAEAAAAARENQEAQTKNYQAGQSRITDVLRARELVTQVDEAGLEARKELALAVARLRTARDAWPHTAAAPAPQNNKLSGK